MSSKLTSATSLCDVEDHVFIGSCHAEEGTIYLSILSFRYGFVEFEDNRDADDAVYELNGKELCGERIIVEHARGPRRDRDGYGGGYGGSGRSKCSLLRYTPSPLFPWVEEHTNIGV